MNSRGSVLGPVLEDAQHLFVGGMFGGGVEGDSGSGRLRLGLYSGTSSRSLLRNVIKALRVASVSDSFPSKQGASERYGRKSAREGSKFP